jgi:hypothetical protein
MTGLESQEEDTPNLGTQIPVIVEKSLSTCGYKKFQLDTLDDHLCTCTVHSDVKRDHDWTHFKNTYSPITLTNISSINLVFVFRCSSSPINTVYVRRVDSSSLVFVLSSLSIHSKQLHTTTHTLVFQRGKSFTLSFHNKQ